MYLLRIVEEGTGMRAKAVPGQVLPDGKEVRTDYNVQGDATIRKKVGVGGYLVTNSLTERGLYYQAGELWCPDDEKCKELKLDEAPEEGKKVYRDYIKGRPLSVSGSSTGATATITKGISEDSLLGELMRSRKMMPPKFETTGFYIEESTYWVMVRNITKKIPTIIYGHSGTGKTELVQVIAEKLKINLEIFDMGSALDPTATLVGVHRLKDGKSVFDYSRFYHAIQQPGIVLLDELSRAPENTTNLLLPLLDNRRTLYTDIGDSSEDRVVKMHPDCILIATANIGSEYVGVNLLDKALMSRFFKVELEYPDNDIEVQILTHKHQINDSDATQIVKVCHAIRKEYFDGSLSRDVSMRESLGVAELVKDGFPLDRAMKLILLPCYEGGETGERKAIHSKILAM